MFHPTLFFSGGTCREAFTRYQEVFGGDLEIITVADVPEGVDAMPGAEPHHVVHAALTIGDGLLMGCDDPTGDGGPKLGVAVTYAAPDVAEGKRVFEALRQGGEETMPFESTFWSPGFGACTDRYGVQWMIDVSAGDAPTA